MAMRGHTIDFDQNAVAELRRDIVEMLSELPPQIAYACAKTGLLLLDEQLEHYSQEAIAEWKAAIDEYFRLGGDGRGCQVPLPLRCCGDEPTVTKLADREDCWKRIADRATALYRVTNLPATVYRTVVYGFLWIMLAAWLAFGDATGNDLDLTIATVLFVVFLGLPIIMYRTVRNRLHTPPPVSRGFLDSQIDIATGTVSGREAWLGVALIPVALALAATLIGGVYVFMS